MPVRSSPEQGRVTELADPQQRIEAIAKNYATNPNRTLIVSPDYASREAINHDVRVELKEKGTVAKDDHILSVLTQRSEMTSDDSMS
jgi:hypothetical protein